MLAKTIIAATLALAATVSAQVAPATNHITFTDPVGDDGSRVYIAGKNTTFGWSGSCTKGDWIAPVPTAVSVELVNSDNSNAVQFVAEVTKFDCSGPSGNAPWVPPTDVADQGNLFSLRMRLGANDVYSGKFKIQTKTGPVTPPPSENKPSPTPNAPPKSAANIVAPVLSGAAAIAAGALMFL
ncbi:hypothetical protein FBU30_005198 [Linnemannia zychae]|nr:hypothetical protein FBU30_005198 [Linnemannia zychae]